MVYDNMDIISLCKRFSLTEKCSFCKVSHSRSCFCAILFPSTAGVEMTRLNFDWVFILCNCSSNDQLTSPQFDLHQKSSSFCQNDLACVLYRADLLTDFSFPNTMACICNAMQKEFDIRIYRALRFPKGPTKS